MLLLPDQAVLVSTLLSQYTTPIRTHQNISPVYLHLKCWPLSFWVSGLLIVSKTVPRPVSSLVWLSRR